MKLPVFSSGHRSLFPLVHGAVFCGLLAGVSLALPNATQAQTAASLPPATLTPGLPDPSVIAAYSTARTPLVGVALGAAQTGGGTTSSVSTVNAAVTAVPQRVQDGVCTQIVLHRPATGPSKRSSATSATAGATSQPVVAVVLTYDPSRAGEMVWVQMLGTGTLTADDGAGHTYDGSQGFFLTLDANAMATFNYQAPNVGGTYQVLTRLENVATVLPFLVPDPAP